MKIEPKKSILLIKKHKKGQLKADIVIEESDENKTLISGEVLNDNLEYKIGETVIFGKYALFTLVLQGEKYYFLDIEDVLATADYREY